MTRIGSTEPTSIARIEAERDGWRAIARDLLRVAFGEDDDANFSNFELPPVEIIGVRGPWKPLLEQFWRDLTRKHEQHRKVGVLGLPANETAALEVMHEIAHRRMRVESIERELQGPRQIRVSLVLTSIVRNRDIIE